MFYKFYIQHKFKNLSSFIHLLKYRTKCPGHHSVIHHPKNKINHVKYQNNQKSKDFKLKKRPTQYHQSPSISIMNNCWCLLSDLSNDG